MLIVLLNRIITSQCTVGSCVNSETRINTNSITFEAVSTGADVKHIIYSWWGLVQLSYHVHIFRCTTQRKLGFELFTSVLHVLCVSDSH